MVKKNTANDKKARKTLLPFNRVFIGVTSIGKRRQMPPLEFFLGSLVYAIKWIDGKARDFASSLI